MDEDRDDPQDEPVVLGAGTGGIIILVIGVIVFTAVYFYIGAVIMLIGFGVCGYAYRNRRREARAAEAAAGETPGSSS